MRQRQIGPRIAAGSLFLLLAMVISGDVLMMIGRLYPGTAARIFTTAGSPSGAQTTPRYRSEQTEQRDGQAEVPSEWSY
jgi:hypothetical protein